MFERASVRLIVLPTDMPDDERSTHERRWSRVAPDVRGGWRDVATRPDARRRRRRRPGRGELTLTPLPEGFAATPTPAPAGRTNGEGIRNGLGAPRARDVEVRQGEPAYRQTRSSAEPALTLSPPPDDVLKRTGVPDSELAAAAGRRRGRFGRKLGAQVALPVVLTWGLGAAGIWFLLPADGRLEAFVPLAAVTAVAALLGALMAALATAGVARDVAKLRDEARRVAMGELTAPVTTNRDDELGEIAGSLERMRLSLQEGLERLRKRRRGA